MKYAILCLLSFCLAFCGELPTRKVQLPESGIWTNYKYPLYLRQMRSARFVQNQMYLSAIAFKTADAQVWVQYRLKDWHPYNPVSLGNKKWLLRTDSSDITIPLELTQNSKAMFLANEMFEPVSQENALGTAYSYYADKYHNGNKQVTLKATGEIIGLDSFVAFKPIIDYSTEPGTADLIYLQSVSGAWNKFGLIVTDNDALEIYRLKKSKLVQKMYRLQREIKPIIL
jgi:hypothetical protein